MASEKEVATPSFKFLSVQSQFGGNWHPFPSLHLTLSVAVPTNFPPSSPVSEKSPQSGLQQENKKRKSKYYPFTFCLALDGREYIHCAISVPCGYALGINPQGAEEKERIQHFSGTGRAWCEPGEQQQCKQSSAVIIGSACCQWQHKDRC